MSSITDRIDALATDLQTAAEIQMQAIHDLSVALSDWETEQRKHLQELTR